MNGPPHGEPFAKVSRIVISLLARIQGASPYRAVFTGAAAAGTIPRLSSTVTA
jgi:hypothetical protein